MIRTLNGTLAKETADESNRQYGLSPFPHEDGRPAWLVGTPAELAKAGVFEILGERRREDHCTHPKQAWCDCDWCRINNHWRRS